MMDPKIKPCQFCGEVALVAHGWWIPVGGGQHKCSHYHTVRKTDMARDHYCSNCGAMMDGRN